MKAQWDEGGGRILLGDNTGGGAVMLRPITFQSVGVLFQLDWLICTYIYLTICIFNSDFRVTRGMPVHGKRKRKRVDSVGIHLCKVECEGWFRLF